MEIKSTGSTSKPKLTRVGEFVVGTQVAYIPPGMREPEPAEYGFVTELTPEYAYCRFWSSDQIGVNLRTKANSEPVPYENLAVFESVPQPYIIAVMKLLDVISGMIAEKENPPEPPAPLADEPS